MVFQITLWQKHTKVNVKDTTIIIHIFRIIEIFNDWFQFFLLTSEFKIFGKWGVLRVLEFSCILNIFLQIYENRIEPKVWFIILNQWVITQGHRWYVPDFLKNAPKSGCQLPVFLNLPILSFGVIQWLWHAKVYRTIVHY